MASRASIGGHPIHPMLIPFPIGLLVFSLIADLIYLWRGNPVWKDYVAFYTLLGGILGAAAAAIPGLIDWATLTDPAAVKRLTELMDRYVADGRSTPGPAQKNDVAVDLWKAGKP